MRYIILEAGDVKELTRQVQELIDQGWEPQGGVSAASNQTMVWWYYQAMIRRERDSN
jgi:Domain of unknown function (DUF1737)